MNKFVYFMAVGLAFTVLQVATVEADPNTDGYGLSLLHQFEGGPQRDMHSCWAAQAAGPPMEIIHARR